MIMALIFSRADAAHDEATDALFAARGTMRRAALIFLLVLVALLLSGTFKIDALTNTYGQFTLPLAGVDRLQEFLNVLVPFDASKGEEGVSVQGVMLIALLILIGITSYLGLEQILERFNRWTFVSLALVALTLLVAAVGMKPQRAGLDVLITGRFFGVALALIVLGLIAWRGLTPGEIQEWLWESWRFVKQIFPLLIVGVFIVGVLRQLIRPEWIEAIAGENTIAGNLAGVVFGVFMYFPTLVEVPIANMFLQLGMHRGPLLAYLMSDPELSLQSILIISTIIGRVKAWTYVGWVALFSMLAGLMYGAWIDGASIVLLAAYLIAFLALLAAGLYWVDRRNRRVVAERAG